MRICCGWWRKRQSGFTLPEMLVVIAIAGILAAIAYASYSEAKAQSRDRLRMAQLEQLKVALEQYKDKYGRYPAAGCGAVAIGTPPPPGGDGNWWAGPGPLTPGAEFWGVSCDDYIVAPATMPSASFVPDFVEELPRDPSLEDSNDRGYYYAADSLGQSYKIVAHFSAESLLASDYSHPFARCPFPCGTPTGLVCGDPVVGGGLQSQTYAVFAGPLSRCW